MGIAASAMIGLGLVGVAAASNELAKDKNEVTHYVANGGCLEEFRAATSKCDPYEPNSAKRRVVDVEACIRATAALRECFGRNPQYFEHQYIKRLDSGLDGDKASPEQEEVGYYRWWTGMRRS